MKWYLSYLAAVSVLVGAIIYLWEPNEKVVALGGAVEKTTQLGPKRGPLVVLDPGHGGGNTGGLGDGLREKDITLEISRKVAEKLGDMGIRVQMTRWRDEYLLLRERSDLANTAGADLFVSIHTNASPSKTHRGFETYYLPEGRVVSSAAALRARGKPHLDAIDHLRRVDAWQSSKSLATRIHDNLGEVRGKRWGRGVKTDAMHVLLGATMPSVLVEVGFLDHSVEGPDLAQDASQEQIAGAIAEGILASVEELYKEPFVASR